MASNKILVVDDEDGVRFAIRDYMESQGYEVEEAASFKQAKEFFQASRPCAVIIDYILPDANALDLRPRLKETAPSVPLVILTGLGSIALAVKTLKEGEEQFLTKP